MRRPARIQAAPRTLAVGLTALLVLATAVLVPGEAASAATAVQLTGEEQEHLDLLNRYRTDRGLAPLSVDARVQVDARQWAVAMAGRQQLSHDPGLADDCYAASSTCSGWAENVGRGSDHEQVFALFAGSSSHARNMSTDPGSTVRAGVAVFRSGGTTWVVQRFMRCECDNEALAESLNRQRERALAFSQALHVDFLGADGSPASLDEVAAPLAYGVGRETVVWRLAYSDQWVGAMVDELYRSTLGRAPDDEGRRYWIAAIRSGQSPAEVAALFYASSEYFAAAGGTTHDWVGALYRALLGRSADADGLSYWAARAQRDGRVQVAREFYQSTESRGVRVDDLYERLLDRPPDRTGRSYWIARLVDGQDVRLAIELAASQEYLERAVERFP